MQKGKLLFLFFLTVEVFGFTGPSSAQEIMGDTILLNAFKQGKVNNCVSIALIKAAIGTFGLSNQYKVISSTDSNIIFKLRNDDTVILPLEEINYSIASNYFIQKNSDKLSMRIKAVADTCFAIMCKREQQLLSNSFEIAVKRLNAGYKTSDIARLLGLKFELINTNAINKLSKQRHIIIYNFYHTAYSTAGFYDEALSKSGIEKINQFKWYHKGQDNEYLPYLCDIKEGYKLVAHLPGDKPTEDKNGKF